MLWSSGNFRSCSCVDVCFRVKRKLQISCMLGYDVVCTVGLSATSGFVIVLPFSLHGWEEESWSIDRTPG